MMKKFSILLIFTLVVSRVQAQSVFDQMNNWVGSQLAESTGIGAYLFLLLGGVLASLLPCVYPVYPLTVSFLRNKKSKLGKFAHPLTYYLPFFGGQLDSKQEGLGGTLLMGAGAGLLSSACVGPIVVSILVAIASNVDGVTIGLAATAAFKMMLFGLGVGVPVLLLGVFGLALPKSGKWMLYVQWVFALLIGYFAYGYLIKGFNGLGLSDTVGFYLFIGSVLVFLAAFNLQETGKSNQLKTKVSLFTLAGVVGFFIIGANTLPAGTTATAPNQMAIESSSGNIEQKGELTWYLNKEAAYQKAAETGKLVFVDFHGDWCTNCKAFQKNTQEDKALNSALQNAILYKVYDTSPEFEKYRNDPRFPELKVGLPFFLITDGKGNVIYKTNDYTKTEEMQLFLN